MPASLIDSDPEHAEALAALPSLADRIRYAAEHAPDPRTATVRAWLRTYDVQTQRPYASSVLSAWRRQPGPDDIGEQPASTPELLTELDAAADAPGPAGASVQDAPGAGAAASAVPPAATVDGPPPVQDASTPAPVGVQDTSAVEVDAPTTDAAPVHDAWPFAVAPVQDASATEPQPVPPGWRPPTQRRPVPVWPVVIMCLGAFVAVWSGWVGLGELAGFGEINLLPGIAPAGGWATINSAITLPIGVEAYAAYALWVWLSGRIRTRRARRFAMWSALCALAVGCLGQAAYHVMTANPDLLQVASDGSVHAPVWVVIMVSSLPVAVLGMGAALAHMVRSDQDEQE